MEEIQEALIELSREARELYLGTSVPELHNAPSPLEFYRDWVSPNLPVVIRGGASHFPALNSWTPDILRSRIGHAKVTVAVTPDGLADAPKGDQFVMPEERSMNMEEFLDIIEDPETANGVFYIQKQNSNLTEEFVELMVDVDEEISWASEAFNKKPDAVNFWMGDSRAVTSMHKDPYENVYCVIRGEKEITLQPPSDLPWIPYKDYSPAVYKEEAEARSWKTEPLEGPKVPWIAIDPLNPDLETWPSYRYATQLKVKLRAGDILYLPSFWFHHLTQSQGCIAVNYWYDMQFDVKYNYFNLLQNLKKIMKEKDD